MKKSCCMWGSNFSTFKTSSTLSCVISNSFTFSVDETIRDYTVDSTMAITSQMVAGNQRRQMVGGCGTQYLGDLQRSNNFQEIRNGKTFCHLIPYSKKNICGIYKLGEELNFLECILKLSTLIDFR